MFGFGNKLKNLGRSAKKVENRNLLEGIASAVALVMGADGDFSDAEFEHGLNLMQANDKLSVFKPAEIEEVLVKYAAKLKGSYRVTKPTLLKEIRECAGNDEDAEQILLCAIDIAEQDEDGLEDKEIAVIKEIASALGLKADKYLS